MTTKQYANYLSSVCVYLIKEEQGKTFVLLQKRQNTNFADGWWEAGAAGHVDNGENPTRAAIHEAKEELKIKITENDLKFASVSCKKNTNFNSATHSGRAFDSKAFYIFHFFCSNWKNVPQVGEKNKCSEIKWFDIKKLPKKIIVDRKLAIKNYLTNTNYFNFNW